MGKRERSTSSWLGRGGHSGGLQPRAVGRHLIGYGCSRVSPYYVIVVFPGKTSLNSIALVTIRYIDKNYT
jgi:hypothetical protein